MRTVGGAIGGLLAVFLFWPAPGFMSGATEVLANGGTLRLANVPMGAYLVSVFTDPTPVRPDSLDVSVLVVNRSGGTVAEGLDVRVRTRHLGGAVPDEERPATREQADDPRYYAAKFDLGAEGPWEIRVAVDGPEGAGEAGFEVSAREPGVLGNPVVLVLLALLPLALIGGWIALQPGGSPPEDPRRGDAARRNQRQSVGPSRDRRSDEVRSGEVPSGERAGDHARPDAPRDVSRDDPR